MRAVIEKDALQDSFSGALSDTFIAAHSSILGITPAILEEYLSINDGAGLFQVWFDRVFSTAANHYLVTPDSLKKYGFNECCIRSNYVGAAFHGAGLIIAKSSDIFNSLNPGAWGVNVVSAGSYKYVPANNKAGSKIADIYSLAAGDNNNPEILKPYFSKENKVFVFDKNINLAGADLLCELTKFCSPTCKFVVMSNFNGSQQRGLLSRIELEKHLNRNKFGGTIEVVQADKETIKKYHDRFIFIGDRYQVVFSSGLDCFGRAGSWNNSDGDVTIHCVYSSSRISEFKAGRRILKLKSKG